MSKIRIYELAKELQMDNKQLLAQVKEMGYDVKSHMSVLEEGDVQRIKDIITGVRAEVVVDERVRPNVIRRRTKVVQTEPEPEQKTAAEAPPEAADETLPRSPVEKVEAEEQEAAGEEEPPPVSAGPVQEAPAPTQRPKKEYARIIHRPDVVKPAKPEEQRKREPIRETAKPAPVVKKPPVKPVAGAVTEAERPEPASKEVARKKQGKKLVEVVPENIEQRKKTVLRRREIIEKSQLYDRAGGEGRLRPRKSERFAAKKKQTTEVTIPKAIKRRIKVDDTILVGELAKRMGIKGNEVIKKLMQLGVMVTINQVIDFDAAALVGAEFGYEIEKASFEETDLLQIKEVSEGDLAARPPVVTIMGHVDHGKTSLLDAIRHTNVTAGEAGGITQHIGAYHVNIDGRDIVFLDTPGHEAFTAMRARGAKVTDVVVLVVAADDGVMEQTKEAVNHARAAEVPIIVAINKIDKPEANPDRVKRELAELGLLPEDWGGQAIFAEVSAKQKKGIKELLELILLQAEILELKAAPKRSARGRIIEAKIDKGRGPVATVLIQKGTLKQGDPFVCGQFFGKVRAMFDDNGIRVVAAGPSMPILVQGLSGIPMAGDEFIVVEDEKKAKQVSAFRRQKLREVELSQVTKISLEKLFEKMKEGEVKELKLVLKADVQGSLEALSDALTKLSTPAIRVNVIHGSTGAITESDVLLASASDAIVIGFNVRPHSRVQELAEQEKVDMRTYDVIYQIIDDVRNAMSGLLEPIYEEKVLGRAEVRQIFAVSKIGTICGSFITEGKIERGAKARLVRDGVVTYNGRFASLRRFKEDVKEVQSGYECGIGLENYNDVKVGDVIEAYVLKEVRPTL
ncbi:MAG: translation initiation factor IF-2 [Thermodesulfobacteriota bacterium]|nr:translation initiation factor IF-2 [Thermodesulfobacteriota bacterium]